MEAEIYTVDINSEAGLGIYGGGAESAEIYNYREDYVVSAAAGYEESIVYTKFLPNGTILIVTLNGIISIIKDNKEIATEEIGEDAAVALYNGHIIVGTESGKVYIYDNELVLVNTCSGHFSSVTDVDFRDGRVYSLSESCFLIHDEYGNCIYTFRRCDSLHATKKCTPTAFCHIGGEMFAVACAAHVRICKGKSIIFDVPVDNVVDTMIVIGRTLVIGGAFEQIILVDLSHHYAIFKLELGTEVTQIKFYKDNVIIFSTGCDRIGILDIRNLKTLRLLEGGVKIIYDFAFSGNDIIVGGEAGTRIFDLDGNILMGEDTMITDEEICQPPGCDCDNADMPWMLGYAA